ncbi:MAG: hypothetical protein ACJ79T_14400 [Myxococcales bacterium]
MAISSEPEARKLLFPRLRRASRTSSFPESVGPSTFASTASATGRRAGCRS